MVDYTTSVRHSRIRALGPFAHILTAGVVPGAEEYGVTSRIEYRGSSAGLRAKIERVQALCASGEEWDPIAPETVEAALALIERFLNATGMRYHADAVSVALTDGEGGVYFSWWADNRPMVLSACPDEPHSQLIYRPNQLLPCAPYALNERVAGNMVSIADPTDVQMTLAWLRFRFQVGWP